MRHNATTAKPPPLNPPSTLVRRTRRGEKRFVVGKLLGKGGFARCFQVTDASDPSKVYAAKIVQKNCLTSKTEMKLISEIKIHRSLKHDGIVKLYTQFEDDDFVYIIMELCPNQTLVEMLRQRKNLTEVEVRYFAIQILLTVQYLHREGVIHRDLKLGNLFLGETMNTKLGDFGLATKLESEEERRKTICGTPNYIAPEIITKGGPGHTYPVDIWSIGCIIYTLLVGHPPFQSSNVNETYLRIKESSYQWPTTCQSSKSAADLVRRMLQVDPEKRITVTDALRHSFFNDPIPVSLPPAARTKDPTPGLRYAAQGQISFYGEKSRQPLSELAVSTTQLQSSFKKLKMSENENCENSKVITAKPPSPVLTPMEVESRQIQMVTEDPPIGLSTDNELPQQFFCSLTRKLMESPIVSMCGHFFNETSVIEWFDSDPRTRTTPLRPCPVCQTLLSPQSFSPHVELKNEIVQFTQSTHPSLPLLKSTPFSFPCLQHFEKTTTPSTNAPQCVCLSGFVKTYLDYSSKYGLAYELFDGKIGAYFNDRSRIVLSANRTYVQYFPYGGRGVVQQSKFMTLSLFPEEYAKKVKLINYFAIHFDNLNKENIVPPKQELASDMELIERLETNGAKWGLSGVEKWYKNNGEYIFVMSDGGIQICFDDGSAILFYQSSPTFSFLSPWKSLHTFNLATKNYQQERHVVERLAEAEKLVLKFGLLR